MAVPSDEEMLYLVQEQLMMIHPRRTDDDEHGQYGKRL
jgi:hypothetical protein